MVQTIKKHATPKNTQNQKYTQTTKKHEINTNNQTLPMRLLPLLYTLSRILFFMSIRLFLLGSRLYIHLCITCHDIFLESI
mmetsp:Transcript_35850/g.47467  ORF Transcript_35850/g.47467 Transcript_35850/m.47467 type:complete len:81 (-) Transcript_35850:1702-1944(-)